MINSLSISQFAARLSIICLGVLIVAGFLGCGSEVSDAPATVPVSGKVTLNGQPLAGAKIFFVNPTHTGMGVTEEDGSYTIPEGAIPGENTIYITKIEGEGLDPEAGIDEAQMMAAGGLPGLPASPRSQSTIKEVVPEKYSNPAKTELSFVVGADGSDAADFSL